MNKTIPAIPVSSLLWRLPAARSRPGKRFRDYDPFDRILIISPGLNVTSGMYLLSDTTGTLAEFVGTRIREIDAARCPDDLCPVHSLVRAALRATRQHPRLL